MPYDVITVCWMLSDNRGNEMPRLLRAGETCAHTAKQVQVMLARLANRGRAELQNLRECLVRLNEQPQHFWSASESCELCAFLRELVSGETLRAPGEERALASSSER